MLNECKYDYAVHIMIIFAAFLKMEWFLLTKQLIINFLFNQIDDNFK